MSSFVKHQASPSRNGVRITILITVVWAALLAGIGFLYRDAAAHGGLPHFVARFHVLAVHLPIGVIFLALAMEALGYFTAFSHLRPSIPFVLWIGFLGAVGATLMGYLLMRLEDYSGKAMTLHLWFGLAVVVLSAFALIYSLRGNRILTGIGILGAAFTTAASGHFGGAMVHDGDYLTEFAPAALKPMLEIGLTHHEEPAKTPADPEAPAEVPIGDRLVYADFVAPILEKTCNECHNEDKTKGKLRLDTHELILAGAEGSDFPTVVPGDPDQSELLVRVLLDKDDDEFMPPQGEPLQAAEVELLKLWIKAGAKTETKVADLGADPAIATTVAAVAAIHAGTGKSEDAAQTAAVAATLSVWDTLPPEEQNARLTEVNEAAEKYNFSVMPISAEDARLRINVINGAKDFGDDQLKLIEPVAERVVWLDLARSRVTDQGMKTVRLMRDLERLHLENTAVTDAGIAELAGLGKLEYLNLYGTKVGDGIFETFAKLPALRRVYLWQTSIDPARAKAFERSVNLEINTGSDLPEAAPVPAPEESKTAPAAKKPEEKKADAPKPAAPKPAENKADAPKPNPAPAPAPKPAEPAKVTPTSKPAEAPRAEAPKAAPPAPAPKTEAPKPAEPKPAIPPAPEPKKEA